MTTPYDDRRAILGEIFIFKSLRQSSYLNFLRPTIQRTISRRKYLCQNQLDPSRRFDRIDRHRQTQGCVVKCAIPLKRVNAECSSLFIRP